MIWAYVVIVIMIMLSAYFSASEIAFNASNKLRLRRAAEGGRRVVEEEAWLRDRKGPLTTFMDRQRNSPLAKAAGPAG